MHELYLLSLRFALTTSTFLKIINYILKLVDYNAAVRWRTAEPARAAAAVMLIPESLVTYYT